jgi:hypothetical protein
MAADLDNYITGHYGEDQFRDEERLTCEACGVEFDEGAVGIGVTVTTGETWIVCIECLKRIEEMI